MLTAVSIARAPQPLHASWVVGAWQTMKMADEGQVPEAPSLPITAWQADAEPASSSGSSELTAYSLFFIGLLADPHALNAP